MCDFTLGSTLWLFCSLQFSRSCLCIRKFEGGPRHGKKNSRLRMLKGTQPPSVFWSQYVATHIRGQTNLSPVDQVSLFFIWNNKIKNDHRRHFRSVLFVFLSHNLNSKNTWKWHPGLNDVTITSRPYIAIVKYLLGLSWTWQTEK